jgi:predicted ribonuclease YlaK
LKIRIDDLRAFEPLTENQKLFFEAYKRGDYFIGLFGSPGVGKTFLALLKSLQEVLDKGNSFDKIVVVRSAVQVRDQGFVPGDLDEKMQIYEQPYVEICNTLFGRSDAWTRLKEQSYARFISTTAIRGISIDDAIIIVDECQSMTWHELSSVITRTGHRSKIIFVGDLKQNDLVKTRNDVSGLQDFLRVAKTMPEFTSINFTSDDIVRSSLVKSWIVACEKLGI